MGQISNADEFSTESETILIEKFNCISVVIFQYSHKNNEGLENSRIFNRKADAGRGI